MAEIFGMDLNSLINLLMVFGTFLMVIITYKSVKSSNEQLKLLEKQTHLLLQKQKPSIYAKKPIFHENSINLEILNNGDDIAYEVGVNCHFCLLEYVPLKRLDEPITKYKFSEIYPNLFKNFKGINCELNSEFGYYTLLEDQSLLVEKFKNTQSTFLEKLFSFLDSNKLDKVYPTDIIVFIKNNDAKIQTIKTGETVHCSVIPYFGVTTLKKSDDGLLSKNNRWEMKSLIEIKEILLKNNIQSIGISMTLCCKDRLENVEHFQELSVIIFDFRRHSTLKDAIDEGIAYNRTIIPNQFFSNIGMLPYDMYKSMKKMR